MFRNLYLFPSSSEKEETPILLDSSERADHNPNDVQSPETQWLWVLYTIINTL
jgi:hypothetical protein